MIGGDYALKFSHKRGSKPLRHDFSSDPKVTGHDKFLSLPQIIKMPLDSEVSQR